MVLGFIFSIKKFLLMCKPLPTINQACSMLVQEESQGNTLQL
ncbi:hypothetical protein V6Z12_A11G108300 [Gossypium hirsutum]